LVCEQFSGGEAGGAGTNDDDVSFAHVREAEE
jgi:hypothetical protein